jgi:hypothetical protein
MTLLATVLLVLLVVVLVVGVGCLVCNMANGCPFAWLWWITGGFEAAGTLIVAACQGISRLWSE